jgi:predicted Zn finger-like uncharacterized protein
MIITCSKCSTSFNIPDSAIGEEGRLVRCSKCKNEWVATKASEDENYQEDKPVEDALEASEAQDKIDEQEQESQDEQSDNLDESLADRIGQRRQRVLKRYVAPKVTVPIYERKVFKLVSMLFMLTVITVSTLLALVSYRWVIVDKFPSAQRIYDLAGMYDISNLVFEKIDCKESQMQAAKYDANNNKELAISIPVRNIGNEEQTLNSIRITVFDEKMVKLVDLVLKRNELISPAKDPHIIDGRLNRVPNNSAYVSVEMGNWVDFMLRDSKVITKIAIKKMKF